MITNRSFQDTLGLILLMGTLISTLLVLLGSIFYLIQHGSETFSFHTLQTENTLTLTQFFQTPSSIMPLNLIELGLLALVFTQLIRVAVLVYFYWQTHDFFFTAVSLFILSILVYSLLWKII